MQFANPIFLWALTGLSIPIGIHLLSRKEGKVIKLGSLRHVHETSTQQFRGIRLNEILLLILRCLLIILFTLIISGLHWNTFSKKNWVLIEKGLESQPEIIAILDSLNEDGYEPRFLVENFPPLGDGDSIPSSVNYFSIIENLTSKSLFDVIVFAQNHIDHFRGLRTVLPANVRWISQPLPPLDYTLRAVQIKGDSVFVREGHTSSDATHFTTIAVSRSTEITEVDSVETIRITLISDNIYDYDKKMIKVALDVIAKTFPVELKLTEMRPADSIPVSDCLIWLSDKNIPAVTSKLLYIKPQFTNQQELFFRMKNNQWIITQRVNEEVALQENLTLKLAALLIPSEEMEMKANTKDRRMISDSSAWATVQTDNKTIEAALVSEPNPYLIVIFLLVLFIERVVAYKRNQ